MDQKSLERYIDRVIKLQEERSRRLNTDELESIALDLGLSVDELYREVDAHLQRGRGYMAQSLWDDAIKELREAEALAPGRVEVVMALAEAHANRWLASDFIDDKEQARRLAKSALDLEPGHQPAFELLGRLERNAASGGSPAGSASNASGGAAIIAIAAGGFVMIAGLGVFVAFFVLGTRPDPAPSSVDTQKPAVTKPVWQPDPGENNYTSATATNVVEPPPDQPGSRDLELQVTGPHADKLKFDVRKSRLNVYTDSSFYSLKAVIENVSDQELSEIETTIELLDEDGEVLHRDDPSILWSHQPSIRPGDRSPVNLTQRASAAVRDVRLNIKLIEGTVAAPNYPEAKPVDVAMGAQFPAHLNLEVRERSVGYQQGLRGGGYFRATFELENKGDAAIKELKLQLDIYGAGDKLLDTKSGIVTYSMTPSINPGETWLENFIAQVPERVERYELTVTELK